MFDNRLTKQFEQDGFAWLRNALSPAQVDALLQVSTLNDRPGGRPAVASPLFQSIESGPVGAAIRETWPDMIPVRLVSFDKNAQANWGVPWHQDRIIAVQEHHDLPEFVAWSRKSGVWHCEPPTDLLQEMLFVRVHLDDNTAENGAMQLAPGSHRLGKIPTETAKRIARKFKTETSKAKAGDILVLKMLTLHRSRPALAAEHRRVPRVDFAPCPLPLPLRWNA